MLHKTRAIAFHSIKYSDTSIIVHLYTEAFGRQTYIVKGAYGKKASIKANLFSPLNLLEMEVYHKESSELQKIKEAVNFPAFLTIHSNPLKSAIAVFLAELLFRVLREEAPNQQLFDFLFNSVHMLDLEQKYIADFHLVFMVQFAKYTGFYPSNNYSSNNQVFDLESGKFVEETPIHGNFIAKNEAYFFTNLIKSNYSNVEQLKIDHQTRIILLNKLATYYKLHIPGMGTLKSLPVLCEVFH